MLNREEAMRLLDWAAAQNPGPWREHSLNAARAAEAIAKHSGLDPERAWVSGALHDIARFEGVRAMHHTVAGYNFLMEKGEPELARICMTHSFPTGRVEEYLGKWDVTDEELQFMRDYLANCEMDDYDRLIQLCDALALAEGISLIEKRLVDVALRHGITEYTVPKWRKTMEIRRYFEEKIGASIYTLFDDVVEMTFGIK